MMTFTVMSPRTQMKVVVRRRLSLSFRCGGSRRCRLLVGLVLTLDRRATRFQFLGVLLEQLWAYGDARRDTVWYGMG